MISLLSDFSFFFFLKQTNKQTKSCSFFAYILSNQMNFFHTALLSRTPSKCHFPHCSGTECHVVESRHLLNYLDDLEEVKDRPKRSGEREKCVSEFLMRTQNMLSTPALSTHWLCFRHTFTFKSKSKNLKKRSEGGNSRDEIIPSTTMKDHPTCCQIWYGKEGFNADAFCFYTAKAPQLDNVVIKLYRLCNLLGKMQSLCAIKLARFFFKS